MTSLTVTEARGRWSALIDDVAFRGDRIMLSRKGQDIAALVSAADLAILEALEDKIDLEEAERRLADGQSPLAYEDVRKALDLA